MKAWSAYPIRFLLTALCEKPAMFTAEQRSAAGVSARSILEFALGWDRRDDGLVRSGIETVCRTYESDAAGSEKLLRKLFAEEHLKAHGYLDMPTLAREVKRLVAIAPGFVRDVYVAAFEFNESRSEETSMGSGKIMPLKSDRQQDYNMCRWQLGETFPTFLAHSPEHAIEALVAVLTSQRGRIAESASAVPEKTFEFMGSVARLHSDSSYIWESTKYRHEAHLKMLDAFEAELSRVAADPNLHGIFHRMISVVTKINPWAAMWRQVLAVGIRNGKTVGKTLSELAWAVPILTGLDTSQLAGEFVRAVFAELDADARGKIERAIFSIPTTVTADRADAAKRIRDRLLGCIPIDLATTPEARSILTDLASKGGPPQNRPPFEMHSSFGGPVTDEQLLTEQGVPVEEAPNRKINELAAPIRKFVADHSNKAPTLTASESIVRQASDLHKALQDAPSTGAHQSQIDNGWTHLVSLCACVARCGELDGSTESGRFVKAVLLEGAKHSQPAPSERWDAAFDDHTSWSPGPRIDAAEGLLLLAYRPSFFDQELLAEVLRLSHDPVPAVRLQIADHLGTLGELAPEAMKQLLTQIVTEDPSSSVVHGAQAHQLWRLRGVEPNEVGNLAFVAFNRTDLKGKVAEEVRLYCISIFLFLHLWKDHAKSSEIIFEICSNVGAHVDEAHGVAFALREILVEGSPEKPEPGVEAARLRAFQMLEALTKSAQNEFAKFQKSQEGKMLSELPKDVQNWARGIVQLLDTVASQLYFASGAYDEKNGAGNPDSHPISLSQKQRFLKEAGTLFDILAEHPHPSIIHHLIQTLHGLLNVEPRQVFLRIVKTVKAGKAGGYQFESLAIGEVVLVVNRVFADFRPVLQENKDVRIAMVEMLDVFVEVGWIQAIQLTYRLDEIFN